MLDVCWPEAGQQVFDNRKTVVGLGPMEDTMPVTMPPTGLVTAEQQRQYLFDLNREHSDAFRSMSAQLARQHYREMHPTEVAVWKCMDGRIHLPTATMTPMGIIQPSRNLGGRFNLGWPYFGKDVNSWVHYSHSQGRNCIILVTYHFSSSDKFKGCSGFNFDTNAAIAEAFERRSQIKRIYTSHEHVVYPIVLGFETDTDACILHGSNGEIWDLGKWDESWEDEPVQILTRMFPHMPSSMINDLLPLVLGNIKHVSDVKASNRQIADTEHREFVLAIGRGYDWLHVPNRALIVGQYSPNLAEPIAKAASIIQHSMDAGRISNQSFVLMSCALYREPCGIEPNLAKEKSLYLRDFAQEIVQRSFPVLAERMQTMAVIVDMTTRAMDEIEE